MNALDHIKTCPLFGGLNNEEMKAIADVATVRDAYKGHIFFMDGDPAVGLYVLFEGKVRIYKSNPEGKEYTIHIINPNRFFAEAAIFEGDHYPANCIALEDSIVGYFPKDDFIDLISRHPRISLKIIASLSRFLREYNIMVEELALKEVSARLARYILVKAKGHTLKTIIIDISKTELAKKLGTISETLSRNLKKFKDSGIISVNNQEITIHDFDYLEKIAAGEKI